MMASIRPALSADSRLPGATDDESLLRPGGSASGAAITCCLWRADRSRSWLTDLVVWIDRRVWYPSAAPPLPSKLRGALPRHFAAHFGVLVPARVLARRLLWGSFCLIIFAARANAMTFQYNFLGQMNICWLVVCGRHRGGRLTSASPRAPSQLASTRFSLMSTSASSNGHYKFRAVMH